MAINKRKRILRISGISEMLRDWEKLDESYFD
jgi:hypothetical protein